MAENYTPKANRGWQRKPQVISLKDLCIKEIVGSICSIKAGAVGTEQIRRVLHDNVPVQVLTEFLDYGRKALLAPRHLVRLMELLPQKSFISSVDLLGHYQGTECCKPNNSLNWLYGFLPEIAINAEICDLLYKILFISDLSSLKSLAFWAQPASLKHSAFPNIIARAGSLSRLVIRGGADDHILRIVGLNCHSLKYLDVARSPGLSNKGIRNLYLVKPSADERARTIVGKSLLILITSVSGLNVEELLASSKAMGMTYVIPALPEYQLTRVSTLPNISLYCKPLCPPELTPEPTIIGQEDWKGLCGGIGHTLQSFEDLKLDILAVGNNVHVYARVETSQLLKAHFTLKPGLGITELTLFWDKFNWELEHLVTLSDLIGWTPNLEKLKCRMYGGWDVPGYMLPRLQYLDIWTLDDSSVIAFLRHCPSLRRMDVKNVRAVPVETPKLTHQVLLEALKLNPELEKNIEEFIIRPTNLNVESVQHLERKCPKLRRIGDLECWDVSEAEISSLNKTMVATNSKCSLIVLSFPPSSQQVD